MSADRPLAVFWKPEVLLASALPPVAVLELPVVLLVSAWTPTAVLLKPAVLPKSALFPNAVFANAGEPRLPSAPVPPAVLLFASLTVGLQPGATQTGWPQIGRASCRERG